MAKEILFWTHIAVIFAAVSIGFFFQFWVTMAIVILHRLHLIVFNGCLISKIQEKIGGAIRAHDDFLQEVARRFFERKITPAQSKKIDYGIISIPVAVSFLRLFV